MEKLSASWLNNKRSSISGTIGTNISTGLNLTEQTAVGQVATATDMSDYITKLNSLKSNTFLQYADWPTFKTASKHAVIDDELKEQVDTIVTQLINMCNKSASRVGTTTTNATTNTGKGVSVGNTHTTFNGNSKANFGFTTTTGTAQNATGCFVYSGNGQATGNGKVLGNGLATGNGRSNGDTVFSCNVSWECSTVTWPNCGNFCTHSCGLSNATNSTSGNSTSSGNSTGGNSTGGFTSVGFGQAYDSVTGNSHFTVVSNTTSTTSNSKTTASNSTTNTGNGKANQTSITYTDFAVKFNSDGTYTTVQNSKTS